MDNGATERETLEKKLQDPTAEPMFLPLEFLKFITRDFSTERELGRGTYGVVYKGVLQSGKVIAVKKIFDAHIVDLDNNNNNKIEQFNNEITCLMGVRHQNVVQLVGYCVQTRSEPMKLPCGKHTMVERPACLLCFEFHCNGSLDKHVSDDFSVLGWDMRYEIIRGVCRGLHYLHHECHIVHLDLKPQNIMMDATMIPKIIDFGLSRLLGEGKSKIVTKKFGGTLGYIAKEYIDNGIISYKADIFSLGVIMIEIITGKRDYPNIGERTETSLKHYTDEDRRNQNLQSQVNTNVINIPINTSAINGLNECANLFQRFISPISSSKSMSGPEQEKIQGDVERQLQSHLQCLTDTLPSMYSLTDRAEWRIHDPYVADLLSKLKDAVYDAEDLLDEFRWYEKKITVEGNVVSVEPIVNFFHSVTQGSYNKVTDIQKRLNYLSGQLEQMGLLQVLPRFDKSFRPETTALPIEPEIFGRDKEKKNLIRLLTDNSMGPSGRKRKRNGVCSSPSKQICASIDSNEATMTSVRVLPIVGIGGVGKTTLAQDICNNLKVIQHFKLIIWICVSDDFDVKRLTKEAIEQSSGKAPKNDNLNSLQGALANSLNTRRFLLVLDDMWDENEQNWKQFCAPFRNVLQGSMMLVTTRSPKVADLVRTMDPFPLEGLKKHAFWEFFKLCVFGSNSSNIDPELEQIGEKIIPKLKGSPLAAKTLGRLLRRKLEPVHWERILNSELWELSQEKTDILPALRLSYMYLPLYLKKCFSFCAVYPKDYIFNKGDLAEIWVALGLVEDQKIPLHHAGGQYFEELADLSFFQKYPRSQEKYVIHDLMHDMAQLVSKDECFTVKDTMDIPKIPKNVRHLLVLKGGSVKCSDLNLSKHRKLRTLLCDLSLKSKIGNTLMEQWCADLSCMRVMVCSSISKWGLPGSISNLKHLRYLKILDSSICKSLPSEFCCLYNMQRFYAKKWDIDDIPSGFAKLINLQKFESKKYQFHHEGATSKKEQRRQFKFEKHNGESPPRGFHAQNMPDITSLELDTWDNVKTISSSMNSEQIHSHDSNDNNTCFSFLTDVIIKNCYNLSSLEQFLQPAYMPIIKEINISSCESLESVPAERFHTLRFLELLRVSHCPMIKSEPLFAPSLKKLILQNSGNLGRNIECSSLTILHLSDWPLESIELQIWYLPLLQELKISFCWSLTVIRDSELIYPDITSHGGARSRTGRLPKLTHLSIMDCDKLETIDDLLLNLNAIESIVISDCGLVSLLSPDITSHGGARSRTGSFPKLIHLSITDCDKLETIDDLLLNLPAIEYIEIKRCGLVSLPANRFGGFPRLKYLDISWCKRLNWQSGMVLPPSSLQKLTLRACGDFSAWFPTCLEKLTSLEELQIGYCESIVSVPGHLWSSNLKSLKALEFYRCKKLKSLGEPHKIARIEDLHVADCPELKEIDQPLRKGRPFF